MLTSSLNCLILLIAFIAFVSNVQSTQVLSTVEAINNPLDILVYVSPFYMGLSIPFHTIYQHFSNTLLQGYIKNSFAYGSYLGGFQISLKMQTPKGAKYNCDFYNSFSPNSTCNIDVSTYL